MPEAANGTENAENANNDQQQNGKTFTEAEVNQLVQDRLAQQARNKFGDYDDLKAKAQGAKSLEDRLGEVETVLATTQGELNSTKLSALRSSVAAEFGISTKKGPKNEPSDADLFLTGTDEKSLTAQAERLADRKKHGNVAPTEGTTKTKQSPGTDAKREWLRTVTGD